jgi:hypothetical protein
MSCVEGGSSSYLLSYGNGIWQAGGGLDSCVGVLFHLSTKFLVNAPHFCGNRTSQRTPAVFLRLLGWRSLHYISFNLVGDIYIRVALERPPPHGRSSLPPPPTIHHTIIVAALGVFWASP